MLVSFRYSFISTQLIHLRLHLANRENARAFSRFFFRARILRSVSHCDPSTTILGFESSIPVFVSGAALAKLGHPEGQSLFCRSESYHSKKYRRIKYNPRFGKGRYYSNGIDRKSVV